MSARSPSVSLTREQAARIAEARRLGSAGEAGVRELVSMLDDPSWAVRREVVEALSSIGAPATAPLVELLLTRRDSEARLAAAVDALSGSAAHELAAFSALDTSKEPAVLADLAQILGRQRNAKHVPRLVALVADADDNVAVAAIEALGRIGGTGGIDALISAATSGNFFRMFPAIDVLGRSGDPRAVAPLSALLANPTYTLEAARALGRTGEPAAVAPLAALLTRSSESTVRVAALALAELHASHAERYGDSDAVEAALERANPGPGAERRLIASLNKANSAEQRALAFVLGALGGDVGAAALITLLDENAAVADSAASALKRIGKESEALVLEALAKGSSARRLVLLPTISGSGSAAAVAACLDDPEPEVRALACTLLSRLGAPSVVPELFERLDDPNTRVVQAAIGAIQSLGSAETTRLSLLAAESTSQPRRWAGLRILAYFGDRQALPVFLRALESEDARAREIALGGLAMLEEPRALEALLAAAGATSEKTRGAAMRALGQVTNPDARVGSSLVAGVADSDAWVRYYACQALGRLGAESATDAVVALLNDPAGHVRVAAVESLSHFKNARSRRALLEAAQGTDIDIRRAALIGLGSQKDPALLPVLANASESADAATRLVALSALSDTGSGEVLPSLAKAARDADENVRTAAQGFLAVLESEAASADLIELLRAGVDRDRIVKLLSSGNRGRVPAMASALASADEELARLLCSALSRLRSPEASAVLVEAMSLPSSTARKAVASALASLRTAEAWQALRKAADGDPDPEVRHISAVLIAT